MLGRNRIRTIFHGFCVLLFLSGAIAHAQSSENRESQDQTNRGPILQPRQPPTPYLPKRPNTDFSLSDFFKNLHGAYSVSLMGPRFIGDSNETYNIYVPDVAPLQLYHTFQLSYQVNNDLRIGISESAPQNIANDVVSPMTGSRYGTSIEWYDPNIFFEMPNLIQIPGWSVFTSAGFSLSLSDESQRMGKVTAITFQQSWMVKTWPSPWSYGFRIYLNPQFYTDPMPAGYSYRQTLSGSFGHLLSYRVSPNFAVQTSTNFDFEHRSPDVKGFWHLGDNLEDTFRIGAAIYPDVFPMFMSIVGYFQVLFWNPSVDTSIMGASFSIGF